jgi:hypothetical protein
MMDRQIRYGHLRLAALLALTLAGCATMRVNSYLERGTDFRQFRTYDWAPTVGFSTGDPRLDNNRFFIERLQAAVEQQLAPRGFEKATSGTPDLLIHYHARVDQRLDTNDLDGDYGRCETLECRPFVYEAGTVLIDFVDQRAHKLAWRGWAEGSIDGLVDNQEWLEAKIDETVTKILARLPRRVS